MSEPVLYKDADAYALAVAERYSDAAIGVVAKLRRIADEIEHLTLSKNARDLKADHSYHAAQVIHTLSWGYANLNLERLVSAATEADRAVRA